MFWGLISLWQIPFFWRSFNVVNIWKRNYLTSCAENGNNFFLLSSTKSNKLFYILGIQMSMYTELLVLIYDSCYHDSVYLSIFLDNLFYYFYFLKLYLERPYIGTILYVLESLRIRYILRIFGVYGIYLTTKI
jgi:hypothetical protein